MRCCAGIVMVMTGGIARGVCDRIRIHESSAASQESFSAGSNNSCCVFGSRFKLPAVVMMYLLVDIFCKKLHAAFQVLVRHRVT